MIKRLHLATRAGDQDADEFARAWRAAVERTVAAPADRRPERVSVATALRSFDEQPRHDAAAAWWFPDEEAVVRFEAWLDAAGEIGGALDRLVDPDRSPVVVAEEVVVRGHDWLARRWADGGTRVQHVALAVRADHLTSSAFSARWRDHAGQARAGRDRVPTPIPGPARGLAYVQDHPCPRTTGKWAYDAVSEVWFDDVEGVRQRVDWFRDNDVGRPEDLFRATWFLVLEEAVLHPIGAGVASR